MSYAAGEAMIETQVKAADGFGLNNVSRGNYQILSNGKSDHYAILRMGGEQEVNWIAPTTYSASWMTVIEVWQRWIDDYKTASDLYTNVQSIVTRLLTYKDLDDTSGIILDNHLSMGDEPEEMYAKGGGLSFLRMKIYFAWQEQQTVVFA